MRKALLVLNTGSSSLKFSLYDVSDHLLAEIILNGQIEKLDEIPHFYAKNNKNTILIDEKLSLTADKNTQEFALEKLLDWLDKNLAEFVIVAAGHRVVHGADIFYHPVIVDEEVIKKLESLIPLAPLHQPYNIRGIKALIKRLPNILQVACFDTAFHSTQSKVTQAFALPDKLSPYPIKRYGFHGLSYEYIAKVLPEYLHENANKKIIVAHLGHGASLCAIENGKSVATTMSFTALDGLPMGTRCGDLDPGVILYLVEQQGMEISAVKELLYNKSGLLGVSEISSDVRTLLNSKNEKAKFAIELFVYRIVREIGSLMAALNGLDAIIFTAGIGENSPIIREAVCSQLSWLKIKLDSKANMQNRTRISLTDSSISVWVIPTNEEIIIARYTLHCWRNK